MAPNWITTSKISADGNRCLKSIRRSARIRWPVEETGRNSVTPSTTPRNAAWIRVVVSAKALLVRAGAGPRTRPSRGGSGRGRGRRVGDRAADAAVAWGIGPRDAGRDAGWPAPDGL